MVKGMSTNRHHLDNLSGSARKRATAEDIRREIDSLAQVACWISSLPLDGVLYLCRPHRELDRCWCFDPGAYALGFMTNPGRMRIPPAQISHSSLHHINWRRLIKSYVINE